MREKTREAGDCYKTAKKHDVSFFKKKNSKLYLLLNCDVLLELVLQSMLDVLDLHHTTPSLIIFL